MRFIMMALVLAAAPARAQQPDPSASYRTVETQHFRISYTPDLNRLVTSAAERAEEAYLLLLQQLVRPPRGKIDLLLTDVADITNGYATPFPSNRIVVFVKPPIEDYDLSRLTEWMDYVITHELAHIFHLDVAGSVGRALRSIFGRVPASWPFFPGLDLPRWNIEGLAVEFETRGTHAGRIHGSFHEMVVRTAVLEQRLDPIDRMNGETPIFPGSQRGYIYGSLFFDYLTRKYGRKVPAELTAKTAGSILPPRLVLNRIGKRALGESLTREYELWEGELRTRYTALADSLRASGLTASERVSDAGRYAWFPRVSPDGRQLAFVEEDGTTTSNTRTLDLASGRTLWRQRRNGLGPVDWLSDGSLLTAQYEFAGRYALRLDLYRVDEGGQSRLTEAARLHEVDVDASGNRIVAVELGQGSNRVVLLDRNGSIVRAFGPNTLGIGWSMPRWSPGGDRIAVTRWQQGGMHDIVVLDTLGRVVTEVTRDEAVDASPAWSPDGRYILFWSDRTVIPNLFAFDLQSSRLLQITNVLGGAFHPEVTPDGRQIYFSGYHADGYHIERMPFDPSTWRPAPAARAITVQRPRGSLDTAATLHVSTTVSQPREYSAFKTLRPFYWLPDFVTEDVVGDFTGAYTSGNDLLNRHAYAVSYLHDFEHNRNLGFLSYSWAGFGNPTLGLSAARDWDWIATSRLVRNNGQDTSRIQVLEREDVGSASATFVRRRFRSSSTFALGGEIVHRQRFAADTPGVRFTDPRDLMYGGTARLSFANYRVPAYAISREDGISLQIAGRVRFEPDTILVDRGYRELTTSNAAYKSLFKSDFAHHVIAVRGSGLLRTGSAPPLTRVGGVPGGFYDLGVAVVGNATGDLLPVRGYSSRARRGTRGWSASAEYRLPVALIGRGYRLWPFFLDRMFVSAFADAGNAYCTASERARFAECPDAPNDDVLKSAGAELVMDAGLFSFFNTRMRFGVAQPFTGHGRTQVYITFGQAF